MHLLARQDLVCYLLCYIYGYIRILSTRWRDHDSRVGSGLEWPSLVLVVECTIPNLDRGSIVGSSIGKVDAFVGSVQLESLPGGSDPLLVRVTGATSPDLELVAVGLYAVRKVKALLRFSI